MLSSAESRDVRLRAEGDTANQLRRFITRRIWLPKFVYACLPWFYLVAGIGALLASLYINHWYWILPHYLIFSVACLHFGAVLFRRRKQPVEADPSSVAE